MADTVAFVLEFLRGLMPSFNPLPLSCHRLFFWFFPVTSQLPPSSTSTLLSLSIYHLPPSTEGMGVLSVGESLSGKVWLFNFLAREPRPPLFEETSISAPDEHFFSSLVNPLIAWRWWLSSFASREQITGQLIDQLGRGMLSFTPNFSISRNFYYAVFDKPCDINETKSLSVQLENVQLFSFTSIKNIITIKIK